MGRSPLPTAYSLLPVIRYLAYLAVCWGALLALAAGLFPGSWAVVLLVAAYTTVPLVLFIRRRGWWFYPRALFRLLVVRVTLYTQLVLPVAAAAGLLGMLAGAPFGHAVAAGRALVGAVLALAALFLLAGYLGSRRLVVREVEASVPGLPGEFDGLRIAQISDLHVGPHTSRRFLRQVVRSVRGIAPDLVAVTGDLIDDRAEDVAHFASALAGLAAPLGVYLIPGNHDVYAGWAEVERALRAHVPAQRVLVNDAHVIRRGGAALALLGTGDPAGAGRRTFSGAQPGAAPDVERAFSRVPAGATVVAFAHNPALWGALARRGAALTLSGHTHWGQLALPGIGWSLASPFLEHAMGGHRSGDALLYINPGTGYWGIPFRIGAFPEVTAITLRSAPTAEIRVGEARGAGCESLRVA